ncbi:hypothetical protein [Sulfobacillus harzensis]|uniref:Uncharacterized protein n=1 Tax=Sulfobacillus harzensis TaxID=2729629 RepID=A0A7Y0L7L9_9FIRM|nr:hypothetical protein [Sulfobacillus harzensis]NMP24493.1 hypothetical protein [Sulfobacillus harzensis]
MNAWRRRVRLAAIVVGVMVGVLTFGSHGRWGSGHWQWQTNTAYAYVTCGPECSPTSGGSTSSESSNTGSPPTSINDNNNGSNNTGTPTSSGGSSSGSSSSNPCAANPAPSYCYNSNWSCTGTAGACINGWETTTYPAGCPESSETFNCGSNTTSCQGPSIFVSCAGNGEAYYEPTRIKSAACGDANASGVVRNGANYLGPASGCATSRPPSSSTGSTTTTTTTTTTGYTAPSQPTSCPAGQELAPVTTYTTENRCTPTYTTETYTSAVQVPVTTTQAYTAYRQEDQTYTYTVQVPQTRTGVRYVKQPYTAYRTVPVTTRVWVNTSHWATGRRWVSTGGRYDCYWVSRRRVCRWVSTGYWQTYSYWVNSGYWQTYSYWVNSGYWSTRTTYTREAYTAYRTVRQTYTYTVYVPETRTGVRVVSVPYTAYRTVTTYQTEYRTGTEQVQTGETCQSVTIPVTTDQCEPVTVTTTTQSAGPQIFDRCMPKPLLSTYHGQPVHPPTHDNWVTAGGAPPNTLLPGPGWAIDHTQLEKVITTCVGSGANQSCSQQVQPDGVGYQEVYDPNDCPYPVVQFSPNPTVSSTL